MIQPGSQGARLLNALKDGHFYSVAEIHRRAGASRLNSLVARLRKDGWDIEHRTVKGQEKASLGHQYRLLKPWPDDMPELGESKVKRTPLSRDDVPRDDAHRYRIYIVDDKNRLLLMAFAPTEELVGVEICRLGREGQVADDCVGILDTFGVDNEVKPGEWIVNPFGPRTT